MTTESQESKASKRRSRGYYRIFVEDVGWRTLDLPIPPTRSLSWRYQIEVDENAYWWLVKDGRRSNRNPWRPVDPWEALVATALLYALNELGPVPIRGEFLEAAEKIGVSVCDLQWDLRKQAFRLWLRRLIK